MSRCPAITFQILIVPKIIPKHTSIKVPLEITIRTDMFKLPYVYVEYEASISSWDI